ncbi:GDSL-type esterase/lipase family protein [Nocardia rosealba]|uniref:GDSL-type esterase/lipase family protein n=1 Tax=Nocardia rosealba TaxID=2878563 RepID=UPI001CDA22E0|nr:GDSL-type esterase/lipase family protein [Nocardia rosealba]MCA2205862.1 GDSL-type esterase/lipase family protein [Nocardia rosealba]
MQNNWVAGFRNGVISPDEQIKLAESRGFEDETVRHVLHMAGGGTAVRVRLTNRYGVTPLLIGAARVAVRKAGSAIVSDADHEIRFGGDPRAIIEPGAELVSDPVDLPVAAGQDLLLSLYLPESTGSATFAHQPGEVSYLVTGDRTADVELADAQEVPFRFFVTGVDVLDASPPPIAVAFGDSWFEGVGTTPSANRRSVDVLNSRLTRGWVVNNGIAGNRLTAEEIGESGIARFGSDAIEVPGVSDVLVNFGINDLILGGMAGQPSATADELIAGFTELADRAHAAGLRIHVATIGPYAGCIYPGMPLVETQPTRHAVNEWLRRTDIFDSVFDVDRAVADPARPDFIRPEFDSGDGMHLNDAGAAAMAHTVDLAALFRAD